MLLIFIFYRIQKNVSYLIIFFRQFSSESRDIQTHFAWSTPRIGTYQYIPRRDPNVHQYRCRFYAYLHTRTHLWNSFNSLCRREISCFNLFIAEPYLALVSSVNLPSPLTYTAHSSRVHPRIKLHFFTIAWIHGTFARMC